MKAIAFFFAYAVYAGLVLLYFSGCKTVPIKNTRECVVAGVFQAGLDCATTNTSQVSQMDFEQMIVFLEPQGERLNAAGKKLPPRAGAVIRSDEDFTAQKTSLEQACALLRDRCTPEMKDHIEGMQDISDMNQRALEKKLLVDHERMLLSSPQ